MTIMNIFILHAIDKIRDAICEKAMVIDPCALKINRCKMVCIDLHSKYFNMKFVPTYL